jgi:hypothetical protein
MRHKIREQSYVDPELLAQVRAYEAAKGWTHSAFTKEAYKRFLAVERGNPDLVVRRLDVLTQGLERFHTTLELLGMTLALHAKLWCRSLPASPSTPDSSQRGDTLYGDLMRGVASKFRAGRRLNGEVFPANGDDLPPRPGSGVVAGSGKGPGGR